MAVGPHLYSQLYYVFYLAILAFEITDIMYGVVKGRILKSIRIHLATGSK